MSRRLSLLALFGISLLLGAQEVAPAAHAQDGFAVRFQGRLSLGAAPAPAGTQVTLYQGRTLAEAIECGNGTVGQDGHYTVDAPPIEGCSHSRARPCCSFTFIAHSIPGQERVRENVGSCACGVTQLDRPSTFGRVVDYTLRGAKLPGDPDGGSGEVAPAHWFYGVLILAGAPAPEGTAIVVEQDAPGAEVTVCGSGRVSAHGGEYAVAIDARAGCADDGLSPCCRFSFRVNDERVGACSCGVARLAALNSIGRQTRFNLRGQTAAPGSTAPPPEEDACAVPAMAFSRGQAKRSQMDVPLQARLRQQEQASLAQLVHITGAWLQDGGNSVAVEGTVDDDFPSCGEIQVSVSQQQDDASVGGTSGLWSSPIGWAQGQRRTFTLIVSLMNPGSALFRTGPATTTIYVSNPLHPGEQDAERTVSIDIKAAPPAR
jgi:hypothetical protein